MKKVLNIPSDCLTIQEVSFLLKVDKKIIYEDIRFEKLQANIYNNRFYIKKEFLDSYSKFLQKRRKRNEITWIVSGVLSLFLITGLILVSIFQ